MVCPNCHIMRRQFSITWQASQGIEPIVENMYFQGVQMPLGIITSLRAKSRAVRIRPAEFSVMPVSVMS